MALAKCLLLRGGDLNSQIQIKQLSLIKNAESRKFGFIVFNLRNPDRLQTREQRLLQVAQQVIFTIPSSKQHHFDNN